MDYKEQIQKTIDYIEMNLKLDISLAGCAAAGGYSEYHFLRIFKEVTGLTPADYIRKRRLTEIVKRIEAKGGAIAEVAFEYGFGSKENFTRAFKAEHHILPTEYKAAQNSLKLYEKISFASQAFRVEPEIVELESFELVVYHCDEDYPPNFWNKYNAKGWSHRLSGGAVCEDYGVSIRNQRNGRLDYYAGIREENAHGERDGTIELTIPGGLYAVFKTPEATHEDFVNTIHRTWAYINTDWLKNSGYVYTGGFEFECYVEKSRVYSEKIYVPIRRLSTVMPAEIIKCQRVSHPPVRFIGKRYTQYPNWNDFWENNWFAEIEKAGKQAEINDDSFCVLIGVVGGAPEYYLGEFFPEGTPVPAGFDHADLPAMEAGLCFIKGQAGDCYGLVFQHPDVLAAALEKNGMQMPKGAPPRWAGFERDNCPRWTNPDEHGNQILDYAVYLA
jgi:AraC family transcriptional regulator